VLQAATTSSSSSSRRPQRHSSAAGSRNKQQQQQVAAAQERSSVAEAAPPPAAGGGGCAAASAVPDKQQRVQEAGQASRLHRLNVVTYRMCDRRVAGGGAPWQVHAGSDGWGLPMLCSGSRVLPGASVLGNRRE
jgi:hypothetical protein